MKQVNEVSRDPVAAIKLRLIDNDKLTCIHCGDDITIEESSASIEKYGKYLCGDCQRVQARINEVNQHLGTGLFQVEGLHKGSEEAFFHCKDGYVIKMYHERDCCEDVTIESVDTEENNDDIYTDCSTCHITEITHNCNDEEAFESETWTFYKVKTDRGYDTIRWYGTSNGFYSESVDFDIQKPKEVEEAEARAAAAQEAEKFEQSAIIEKHDAAGNLVYKKYPNGGEVWQKYDNFGRIIHYKNSYGKEKEYIYVEPEDAEKAKVNTEECQIIGYKRHYKDSIGIEVWEDLDGAGNLTHYVTSKGNECWQRFDEHNEIIYQHDKGDKSSKIYFYPPKNSKIYMTNECIEVMIDTSTK